MLEAKKVFNNWSDSNGVSEVFTAQWYPNVSAVINPSIGDGGELVVALEASLDNENWVELTTGSYDHDDDTVPQKLEKPAIGWYLYYRIRVDSCIDAMIVSAFIGAGGS